MNERAKKIGAVYLLRYMVLSMTGMKLMNVN